MRKQVFIKIRKTLAILLAVLFVATFMAASVSACNKVASNTPVTAPVVNPATNPVVDANGLTEAQKTALGNQLLDWADNNWFGKGDGDNGWSGNDWWGGDDSCDCE